MKPALIAMLILILSGCELLSLPQQTSQFEPCLYPGQLEKISQQCELTPWIDFWIKANTLSWKQRKQQLAKLSSSPADSVKMILLSHVPNTPYQDRLRAQLLGQLFLDNHQGKLAEFIQLIVFLPAQEKLELESALTTQTQFNISQEKLLQSQREELKAQHETLAEQQQQINKLLQIEKSIIDKPSEAKP